jgi:hypothetical protein
MYQVVGNPKREREFAHVEETIQKVSPWSEAEEANLRRMGIDLSFLDAGTKVMTVKSFKAIGYCKDRSLAKFLGQDIVQVSF